jgi:hypothetical protein
VHQFAVGKITEVKAHLLSAIVSATYDLYHLGPQSAK